MNVDQHPFSQAAENNRQPILEQLRAPLAGAKTVLEIGAGTGQHAAYFAQQLPHLRWQPSEHPDSMDHLRPRCESADLENLAPPIALDISASTWPLPWPDAVYTANTLHIVAVEIVVALFEACGQHAVKGSQLFVYGPFNYDGAYTSESNASFDDWLKERDPKSGIRDFEWVDGLARAAGFALQRDTAMPANNRFLHWRKG